MGKNERLDELFNRMRMEYRPYKTSFKSDGINNESLFDDQKNKGHAVLFIAKEPNNKDAKDQIDDFRKWWKKPLEFSFSMRLAEWAYGLVNDFPVYKEAVLHREEGMQSIAFMNVNKAGGGGTADNLKLWEVINETKGFLHEEIRIIDPDVIIGSLTYEQAWINLFGNLDWIWTGYDIRVARWNNIKVIEYYHPANRFPSAMSYCLLEKVYHSKVFREL